MDKRTLYRIDVREAQNDLRELVKNMLNYINDNQDYDSLDRDYEYMEEDQIEVVNTDGEATFLSQPCYDSPLGLTHFIYGEPGHCIYDEDVEGDIPLHRGWQDSLADVIVSRVNQGTEAILYTAMV